jgi:TPR repeat protein
MANNIIEFPKSRPLRLERAIVNFDAGDGSKELVEEFKSLADSGFAEADYFLGCIYEDGANGQAMDLPLALAHYEKAASGIGYLEAYLAQGRLLYHGDGGIKKDLHRAKKFYEMVKNYNSHPVACFMLGRMYQRGEGTTKDLNMAECLYKIAIEKGSIFGMLNLAMLRAETGAYFSSLSLRIKAGIQAFLIARKNPHDPRLRGG